MQAEAMILHGTSLLDYYNGDQAAEITLQRDDGFKTVLPIGVFFRSEAEFFPGEMEVINLCKGTVLDIGAGSGIHSLVLQARGLKVTAIDIDPKAAAIMIDRGVKDVLCTDVMEVDSGPYDTLLLLGHGIGMTGDIKGFHSFLDQASALISDNGQLLINSVDVSRSPDPVHLKYHQTNKDAGRYVGEVRMRFRYKGKTGPFFKWLHIDPRTLKNLSANKNWSSEIIYQEEDGEYAARLVFNKSV